MQDKHVKKSQYVCEIFAYRVMLANKWQRIAEHICSGAEVCRYPALPAI
jgi:hypothetical protein